MNPLNNSEKLSLFRNIERELAPMLEGYTDQSNALQRMCELLGERVPYYDWVGFYIVDPKKPRELILGPFFGEPTEHIRIPFGWGVCGQAADREETLVVQDVRELDNYLSCSIHVRSEIVVPIVLDEKFVGEIDVDSHAVGPFSHEDSRFLERLAGMVAPLIG